MNRTLFVLVFTFVLSVVLLAGPLWAETISVPSGATVRWNVDQDEPEYSAGITVRNDSSTAGTVEVTFDPANPAQSGDGVPPGFLLFDGSLKVTANIQGDQFLARVRRDVRMSRIREIRARHGIRTLRLDSMQLARRETGSRVWKRFSELRGLRAKRYADVRPDFSRIRAGDYGYYLDSNEDTVFVWGAVEGTLSSWGIGGVPEPASIVCMVSGVGLLLLTLWRRKR